MFITALDGIFIGVILFSAFLAMLRGFFREVLSLVAWIVAGVGAYYLHKPLLPYIEPYISNKDVALVLTLVIVFIVIFIIISFLTIKIGDMIINSRLGVLDRLLGFIFGVFRGIFIMVIAVLLLNQMIKPEEQSSWLKEAKTKSLLDSLSTDIWNVLPKDPEWVFDKIPSITKTDKSQENLNTPGEESPVQQSE